MALTILAWKIFKAELPIEKFQKSICEMSQFDSFLVILLGKMTCEMYPILIKMIGMLFRVVGHKPVKPWRTSARNMNLSLQITDLK